MEKKKLWLPAVITLVLIILEMVMYLSITLWNIIPIAAGVEGLGYMAGLFVSIVTMTFLTGLSYILSRLIGSPRATIFKPQVVFFALLIASYLLNQIMSYQINVKFFRKHYLKPQVETVVP